MESPGVFGIMKDSRYRGFFGSLIKWKNVDISGGNANIIV